MHLDVLDLRSFYARSALGRAAQSVIRGELKDLWGDTKGLTVAGFGFATPLLRPFLQDSRRVIALMPGQQGVMHWPQQGPNVTVLCEDTLWPLDTGSVDRLVLLHGFETSDQPAALLDEVYRVLGPGGRAAFVVPNRAGLWSRSERTPFGYGRPYSAGQLEGVLRVNGFAVHAVWSSLFQPPSSKRLWRRFGSSMEAFGRHVPVLKPGGVLLADVTKQIPRPSRPDGLAERMRAPWGVLEGIGALEPRPGGASRGV